MENEKTYYTETELWEIYNQYFPIKKAAILNDAIDLALQASWRQKSECIFMAMGYRNYDGDSNGWQKRIKK